MSTNPYLPPPQNSTESQGNPLRAPATLLLIFAGSFLFIMLLSLISQIPQMLAIDTSTPEGMGELFGQAASLLIIFVSMAVVTAGAIAMLMQKAYAVALIGAIAASVPCCSPWIVCGIPLGIWAIVLLVKPHVRERFR